MRRCRWTIWGPVLDPITTDGRARMRWVAHDADRLAVIASRRSSRRTRSTRPSTRSMDSARPARTSSSPTRRAHRLDGRTAPSRGASASTAALPHVVGRRHARLERLARRRRISAHRRSARRTHLDGERPRRRRRHAREARRRQLRGRLAGAHHPRSAHGQRPVHAPATCSPSSSTRSAGSCSLARPAPRAR